VIEGLIGRKIGMVQLFDQQGRAVAATVIQAGPCTVVQVRQGEPGAAKLVQLGFDDVPESKLTKPLAGHFRKAGVSPKRCMREVRAHADDELAVGQEIRADLFSVGQKVDVIGVSKGKGFAGMVKRWKAAGGPKTHGSMFHRRPGSVGSSAFPSRTFRGKNLPGHLGHHRVTVMNMEVLQVRPDQNMVLVKGGVPGPTGSLVLVRGSVKQKAKKQ
jgi:large subunit ribosomal protein L3